MSNSYAKAYTEVLEIISYFNEEEYSKIPKEKIEFYEKHRDKNYNYVINPKIDLSKQHISIEASAILVSLFRDYFSTEKQKIVLRNLLSQNQEKLEREKREKYTVDIFNQKEFKLDKQDECTRSEQLVEYKETFFTKFINFINRLIYGNKK